MTAGDYRLAAVVLDARAEERLAPEARMMRDCALRDLLAENRFRLIGSPGGPYQLGIAVEDNRLVLQVFLASGEPHGTAYLSISPYRRIVSEYRRQCASFAYAESGARSPEQIEALDMARRALHDDGAKLLMERMAGKVEMDLATARGLFTLICACL
jgi:uncharacterized protein (UPF0262 family)